MATATFTAWQSGSAPSVVPTNPDNVGLLSLLLITLDGVEQRFVQGYDIERGMVARIDCDAAGRFIREPGCPPCISKVRGKVEVDWR